jgi:hypothetical protein
MFRLLRLARIALLALLGMLFAQVAMAQGNPQAAARALAKIKQDVADGDAAIKACNFNVWRKAESAYERDKYQYYLVSGKLQPAPGETSFGIADTPGFTHIYPDPCPPKGASLVTPPPPAPPPTVAPVVHRAVHRETSCLDCQGLAKQLNAAIDGYAEAKSRHDPDQFQFAADVKRLSKDLDDCEKNLCPKHASVGLGGLHPFFGVEVGGGWSNTNFEVTPNFNVGGSGFLGGVNGGALFDVPGTKLSIGGRLGWLGSSVSGSTSRPPASPAFDYDVKTRSVALEEFIVSWGPDFSSINTGSSIDWTSGRTHHYEPTPPADLSFELLYQSMHPYVSLGAAQVRTQVGGTAGAFQVSDSLTQTGLTGSVGVEFAVLRNFMGGKLDVYAQWRGIFLPDGVVNIPGSVTIDERWTQTVTTGLVIRY